jgi:hypothetical protein
MAGTPLPADRRAPASGLANEIRGMAEALAAEGSTPLRVAANEVRSHFDLMRLRRLLPDFTQPSLGESLAALADAMDAFANGGIPDGRLTASARGLAEAWIDGIRSREVFPKAA